MTATLLTGAAGQGKTQESILKVKALLQRKLFGKVWVLLPTELQIGVFRARLLDELGDAAHFGVEFFDFYDLYSRLLEISGTPQRLVKDAARFRILRYVLDEVSDQLVHFESIKHTGGFVALVADFIKELKQAEVPPEDFSAVAHTPKDRDLAAIYQGYQNFLRGHNLVDRDGEGWLALALLEENQQLNFNVDLLVVDGYDQFNPVQARLLARLAERLPNTLLTLTYEPERADTAHRRFAQTHTRLMADPVWAEKALERPRAAGSPVLDHLSTHLFDIRPDTVANDGSLSMIEAPTRERESQTVLRRIKRLLLSGTSPEQIMVVARDLEPYTPYFLETAPAYGIPLAPRRGSPLNNNPLVAALLALVDLAAMDFPRRQVMDTLHCPYLTCPDLDLEQINTLDRISREQIVVRGKTQWLDAIRAASIPVDPGLVDEPREPLDETYAEILTANVRSFFGRITPPASAAPGDYVKWLASFFGMDASQTGHFHVLENIGATSETAIASRDLIALDCLNRVLVEVLSAYELVDAYTKIPWESFRADLQTAIDNTTINPMRTANRLGRVLFTSVYEARGLAHDHVFMLGLSEGEFPARTAEDALYIDEERRQMQAQSIPLLTRAESADESSLFYEITALARSSLALSRPYIDDKGNPWPASPYWRAIQALVAVEPERLPIASTVRLDEAARLSETMIALAQGLNTGITPELLATHRWLLRQERGIGWQNAIRARRIESQRAAVTIPHDAYTGHLHDPVLLTIVAETLGPDRLWSASQFNDYGICPFRFFARRLLALEALEEPEEGIDQLQLGSLLHTILEHTYRQIEYRGLPINPDHTAEALAILEETMDRFMPTAPEQYGFRATSLWEQEQESQRRKLRALVEKDFSEESPVFRLLKDFPVTYRHSVRQEVRFGYEGQQAVILDGPAGKLRVWGAIDRVDEINGYIVVLDYKTGSRTIPTEEMVEGRNVQMLVYLHAARQLLGDQTVHGGAFWHIGKNSISGDTYASDEAIEQARENLHQRITLGRQGIFVNMPSKRTGDGHCAQRCEFRQLCRVDRASGQKTIELEP